MTESTAWDDPFYMDLDPQTASGRQAAADKASGRRRKKRQEEPKDAIVLIPQLPPPGEVLTGDEVKRGVSNRSKSAANLKVDGFTYQEIAEILDFETAGHAKRAVEAVLAATHSVDDYDTLRAIVTSRAEKQFRRSSAMASATFLVDKDTGNHLPNTEQLRWHQAAAVDLMNYAIITGAKAPTKVEITPGEAEMDRIVALIASRSGVEDIVDADVIELDAIEALPSPDPEDFRS